MGDEREGLRRKLSAIVGREVYEEYVSPLFAEVGQLTQELQDATSESDKFQIAYERARDELFRAERHITELEAVVEAAELLTRYDTFDMRIVKVREDNLREALRVLSTSKEKP